MRKIKALTSKLVCFFLTISTITSPFVGITNVYAETNIGTVTASVGLNVRNIAGSSGTILTTLGYGTTFIIESSAASGNGCAGPWYYIKYNGSSYGYVCSEYTSSRVINDSTQFPESYRALITALQTAHPTWTFTPLYTGLDWNNSVNAEYLSSYIDGSSEGYRSTDAWYYDYNTNIFRALESGTWYLANKQVTAYFMDPRNFLDERYAMMFETLSYNSSIQTKATVDSIFAGTIYAPYSQYVMNAAATYNVSPTHLASRMKQEGGANGTAHSGTTIYNFFNIGATTGAAAGIDWASGETASATSKTTYSLPWDTAEKAIMGGAKFIANGYISKGQNSIYLERFNVSPAATNPTYGHQYMTNIRAPYSEASRTYNSYSTNGVLSQPLAFEIPVYENMPASTVLPNTNNPNNYLKALTVNGVSVESFSGDTTSYTVYVPGAATTANIAATPVVTGVTIAGTGSSVALPSVENNLSINVTAKNGAVKTYTVKIIKTNDAPVTPTDIINNIGVRVLDNNISGIAVGTNSSVIETNIKRMSSLATVQIRDLNNAIKVNQKLATGDKVSITSSSITKDYTVTIYGDVNGDSIVDIIDLLKVQKHILSLTSLSDCYLRAADANKSGGIDIIDLLKVQKHILGLTSIEQ